MKPSDIWKNEVARTIVPVFVVALAATFVAMHLARAADAATVTVPYGQWLSDWLPFFASGLAALVTWGLRFLPANVVAILGNARVELLLQNAINYGLNAVAGATKGKSLDVNVGNQVLAEALNYAVSNAPGWLQTWAGGPTGLAQKIWGRLELDPAADASAVVKAVQAVTAKPAT